MNGAFWLWFGVALLGCIGILIGTEASCLIVRYLRLKIRRRRIQQEYKALRLAQLSKEWK